MLTGKKPVGWQPVWQSWSRKVGRVWLWALIIGKLKSVLDLVLELRSGGVDEYPGSGQPLPETVQGSSA